MMRYCGAVTDISWQELNPLIEQPDRPRIFSDEVPMADETTVNWFKLSGIEKAMSLYPKLYRRLPKTLLTGITV